MLFTPQFKSSSIFLTCLFLSGCSVSPHIEDWDRSRITTIPTTSIEVSVCFDMAEHTKELVHGLAKEECVIRIGEVQKLVQYQKLQHGMTQSKAEGAVFQGPIEREKRLKNMLSTLTLNYVENDKWECPLVTPNRITFVCSFDANAVDSPKRPQITVDDPVSPDLPPELPDDLKPQ